MSASLVRFPSADEVDRWVRPLILWSRIPLEVVRRVKGVDGTIAVMEL